MGTPGKIKDYVKKTVKIINSIEGRDFKTSAIEMSKGGRDNAGNNAGVAFMNKRHGDVNIRNRRIKFKIAVKTAKLVRMSGTRIKSKSGIKTLAYRNGEIRIRNFRHNVKYYS